MKRRTPSYWARNRGYLPRGIPSMVGADHPPFSEFHPPTSIDPALAKRSYEKLHDFIARGATYGDIDYETIGPRWYAFRYSEHPPDAGIASAHPGVDYLVGPTYAAPTTKTSGWGQREGLAAVAIVAIFALIMAKK